MPARDITVTLKGGYQMTITGPEFDGFSDEIYDKIIEEGMKVLLKKGMDKVSKDDAEGIEAKAKENLDNLKAGKLKATRARKVKSGVPHAVMVEAKRLALNWFKQECRRQGIKFAHVETADANAIIAAKLESEEGKGYIAQAQANLEMATKPSTSSIVIPTSDRKISQAQARAARAAEGKEAKEPATPKLRPGAIPHKRGVTVQPRA